MSNQPEQLQQFHSEPQAEEQVVDVTDSEMASPSEIEDSVELGAPSLAAALEALLLISEEPLTPLALAELVGKPQPEVEQQLLDLAEQYVSEGRGFELRDTDAGWRFYTSAQCQDLVTRFVTDGRQAKLSQAALETLASVAYRQPVTRSQVGAVRGVNPDGVLKTLVARGLIEESAEQDAITHFETTTYFLDRMGIASLSELPPIAEHLPDLDSLDDLLD